MLWTDQVANAPTRGVKVFADRTNGERQVGNLRRKGGYACEWDIIKAIVDLLKQSEQGH